MTMDHNRDSIDRLLEMLDQPQAYSEQEIRDIIGHDKTTRETYRLMVEAKRSSRRMADKPIDVDAATRRVPTPGSNHFTRLLRS